MTSCGMSSIMCPKRPKDFTFMSVRLFHPILNISYGQATLNSGSPSPQNWTMTWWTRWTPASCILQDRSQLRGSSWPPKWSRTWPYTRWTNWRPHPPTQCWRRTILGDWDCQATKTNELLVVLLWLMLIVAWWSSTGGEKGCFTGWTYPKWRGSQQQKSNKDRPEERITEEFLAKGCFLLTTKNTTSSKIK